MKRLFMVMAMIAVLLSCNQENDNQVPLHGTIKGVQQDTVRITYHRNNPYEDTQIEHALLDEEGKFRASLAVTGLKRVTVELPHNEDKIVLLKPGWNTRIHARFNDNQQLDTFYFAGKGGVENQIYRDFRNLSVKTYEHMRNKPQRFIHVLDSLETEMKARVNEADTTMDAEFLEKMQYEIPYSKISRWNSYKRYARRYNYTLDTPYVQDYERQLKATISLNDPKGLKASFYRYVLRDSIRKGASERVDTEALKAKYPDNQSRFYEAYTKKRTGAFFAVIDEWIDSVPVKKDLIYHFMLSNMQVNALDTLQTIYKTQFKPLIADPEKRKVVETKLAALEELLPGNPAPSFRYPDKNGNMVSLADLRGRYVYLDIWATWCGPCIKEIPKLKELHKQYGDEIAFVSVSVDPKKEKWKNFLEKREMEGYQLYSGGNFESQIIEDYMVRGIPRFVMIDPQGNLIDVNAPRPSSARTEKMMKAWIDGQTGV